MTLIVNENNISSFFLDISSFMNIYVLFATTTLLCHLSVVVRLSLPLLGQQVK